MSILGPATHTGGSVGNKIYVTVSVRLQCGCGRRLGVDDVKVRLFEDEPDDGPAMSAVSIVCPACLADLLRIE